jgi:hydrogenase 3 maturation protease
VKDLTVLLQERVGSFKKIAILGVGSPLKSDDAAGILISQKIADCFPEEKYPLLKVYIGESAPENFTGEIKKFMPDHLLVIDAADLEEEPGSVTFIDMAVIKGVSFCTHMLPLNIMLDYLKLETGTEITILGIQPQNLSYDGKITESVQAAIDEVASAIIDTLKTVY